MHSIPSRFLLTAVLLLPFASAQSPYLTVYGIAAGSGAGSAVDQVGDLDGDGRIDFVVGAPTAAFAGIDAGRVRVLSGADGAVLLVLDGAAAGDMLGAAVAGAGDVDGDGVADVMVGAPGADPAGVDAGRAVIISGSTLATIRTLDGAAGGDQLGSAVGAAGDVNDDGYDDVIVGAPGHDTAGADAGRAYVYSGRDGSLLHTFTGASAGDMLGAAVGGGCDIDDDDHADLVVGAPGHDTAGAGAGRALAFSGADGAVLYTNDGAAAGAALGAAVAGLGDLDGDGSSEFAVGAPGAGRVSVYSGSDGSLRLAINGNAADAFGAAVGGAGDADNDGFTDLLVGAPGHSRGGAGAGAAFIHSGADGGLLLSFFGAAAGNALGAAVSGTHAFADLSGDLLPDPVVGAPGDDTAGIGAGAALAFDRPPLAGASSHFLSEGSAAFDQLGYSMSHAGDVNNDGVPDLLAGAPLDSSNSLANGYVRILSGADGSLIRLLSGSFAGEQFGYSVAAAGDVDQDGFDDVVIGAPHNSMLTSLSGRAAIISGQTGQSIHEFFGTFNSGHSGFSVSSAGDFDNDGWLDVIVGAPAENQNRSGRARVYSGRTGETLMNAAGDDQDDFFGWSVSGAGDVNGDGYGDVIVGAPENLAPGVRGPGYARVFSGFQAQVLYTFHGETLLDRFAYAVAGGFDANGDGFDDLIVGIPDDDDAGLNAGSVRVFSGQDGALLLEVDGELAGDSFGRALAAGGDYDGDGYDDFLVGAPGADPQGKHGAGQAYAISGRTGAILLRLEGAALLDTFGSAIAALADTDGDGYPEVAVGAPLADGPGGFDTGAVELFRSQVEVDPPAVRLFGAACSSSSGTLPNTRVTGRPALGSSFTIELAAAAAGGPVVLGLDALAAALPLAPLGAPGCLLLAAPVVAISTTASSLGRSSLGITVPNDPTLVGASVFAQWLVIDPPANTLGLVTSDGVQITIGNP